MELTAQVLRELPLQTHANLLAGAAHFEDAGVYRLDAETAIVQTVDFFPPLVDDPYQFGRIAAANSLSDVYAMGGTPITALNVVGFPDKDLPAEVLSEILRGGAERVQAAGAVIVGGHSVRDAEIKYGLAVTGTIHPERIVRNGGALPGDVLFLTKPLGSGTLTSAAKKGQLSEAALDACIETMTALNRAACEAMLAVGVHACTDVTGFGLVGHGFEMADASGVALVIDAAKVPLMDEAYAFASQGVLTRAHKATLTHVGDRFDGGGVDATLVNMLADAQTSGGLLISVAADRAGALERALKDAGVPRFAMIGTVEAADRGQVRVF